MTDQSKTAKPKGKHELVATVAVPSNFADLPDAEYQVAKKRLVDAIVAAIIAATPEAAARVAARKAVAATAPGTNAPSENEVRHV